MKVLIVDDDKVNLSLLASALRGDYDVSTALDGFSAIAQMKADEPDLVLLDVMMPDLDGMQVLRMMRDHPTLMHIPVIFVTAITAKEGEAAGLELGAVDYITKPIDLRLAKLRIRNQLELKRQRDVIAEQNEALTRRTAELEAMLARVRRLERLLSICMYCKKIRAEGDDWQAVDRYISEHTDTVFSHGICPDCFREQSAALDLMLRQPLPPREP